MSFNVEHSLFADVASALDRYEELLAEDQVLRHAEYDRPDPRRRRLKIACNDCDTPWCCNQRVTVDFVEALVIYRWASRNEPRALAAAIARGKALHEQPALTDSEFFRRGDPCPLLIKGQCTVFSVRPQRCRSHYMAGNPKRCRTELAPTETYKMSPDKALLREITQVADEVEFELLISSAPPGELSETLYFIDQLLPRPRWRVPIRLGWDLIGGSR